MTERRINYGGEIMLVNEKGQIKRQDKTKYSDSWRILDAMEYNNFGNAVRRYALQEILDNPTGIPWKYKNGKQRVFIRDYDHGGYREWRCLHSIY